MVFEVRCVPFSKNIIFTTIYTFCMVYITANIRTNNDEDLDCVHIGDTYTVCDDMQYIYGKILTVVAGPHQDYPVEHVYTCRIESVNPIVNPEYYPFFNSTKPGAMYATTVRVCHL